jgi:hypothetical protein
MGYVGYVELKTLKTLSIGWLFSIFISLYLV